MPTIPAESSRGGCCLLLRSIDMFHYLITGINRARDFIMLKRNRAAIIIAVSEQNRPRDAA